MIQTLLKDFKREYHETGGHFDHRIFGSVFVGLAVAVVGLVIAALFHGELGYSSFETSILIIISVAPTVLAAWYLLRKAGI
jgi:hypothetical protein